LNCDTPSFYPTRPIERREPFGSAHILPQALVQLG
jgi:hypothetical protein